MIHSLINFPLQFDCASVLLNTDYLLFYPSLIYVRLCEWSSLTRFTDVAGEPLYANDSQHGTAWEYPANARGLY